MSDKEWIVLSSTSNGYQLYDPSEGVYSLSPTRKKVKFREERILIGDHVSLDDAGFIEKILPRKNTLQRPRVANADEIFVLVSCIQPAFSSYLLDKFLSLILSSHIKASMILTKADLLKKRELNALKKRMENHRLCRSDRCRKVLSSQLSIPRLHQKSRCLVCQLWTRKTHHQRSDLASLS